MKEFAIDRRGFLKTSLSAAVLCALPAGRLLAAATQPKIDLKSADFLPIAPVALSEANSQDFNGDDINRPHDLLWHKDSYLKSKGGRPAPSENVDVVVIGGGIAGLMSAYRLRDLNTVILEQAPRFGGNSKGERYGNAEYSIGAAYITVPDPGSETEQLLKELGVWNQLRREEGDDSSVNFRGEIAEGFWKGVTDPTRAQEFEAALREFLRISEEEFPDIPRPESGAALSEERFKALDRMSFEQWLNETFENLHPHIREFCQLYAWSSFGGSIDEISAAQMLNFLTSDLGGTLALPGGNAAIAQALVENLVKALPQSHLRGGSMVIDVTPDENGVSICYEDAQGNLKTIRARACVFASPKFVARYVINGIPKEQSYAMERLTYRAYLVANVLIEGPFTSPSYELFCLEGQVPERPVPLKPETQRPFTDLCFGTWAAKDQTDHGVLTIYKALPFDGARHFLFAEWAHEKYLNRIRKGLPELYKSLGLDEKKVKGIRMTRWGHSLPWAAQGLLASGVPQLAHQPIQGRVFFAHQDNWANPCFETSVASAEEAARGARRALVQR